MVLYEIKCIGKYLSGEILLARKCRIKWFARYLIVTWSWLVHKYFGTDLWLDVSYFLIRTRWINNINKSWLILLCLAFGHYKCERNVHFDWHFQIISCFHWNLSYFILFTRAAWSPPSCKQQHCFSGNLSHMIDHLLRRGIQNKSEYRHGHQPTGTCL